MKPNEIRDKIMARVANLIRQHGRAVMSVFGETPGEAGFSYTIGNAPKAPELFVVGMVGEDATWILNKVSERLVAGAPMGPLDLGGPVGVHVLPVEGDAALDMTRAASAWHGSSNYLVAQVVVPDPQGRFPWQDGCTAPYKDTRIFGEPVRRH